MADALPIIYLARHGETAWSVTGQHTGLTDLPLTARGEQLARRLGERLRGFSFTAVLTSPLRRAVQTCELAGFGPKAQIDSDLVEWNYGDYEGLRSSEIRAQRPGWELFRDGCPHGESPQQVKERADHVIERLRAAAGNLLLFSSGHFMRMLAVRWLELDDLTIGARLALDTASQSALGYESDRSRPVIRLWNETGIVNERAA